MTASLTPYHLIKALAAGLAECFDGTTLPMPECGLVPINIYEQDLPVSTAYDGQPEYAPFCLARLLGGTITDANAPENTNVVLILCTYDESADRQGYGDVLHLMQLAKQYLLTHPALAQSYYLQAGSIQWTLQEEDTQGYHIGTIAATYTCPAIIRNEVDYD